MLGSRQREAERARTVQWFRRQSEDRPERIDVELDRLGHVGRLQRLGQLQNRDPIGRCGVDDIAEGVHTETGASDAGDVTEWAPHADQSPMTAVWAMTERSMSSGRFCRYEMAPNPVVGRSLPQRPIRIWPLVLMATVPTPICIGSIVNPSATTPP